jgi:hypothetical protein
MTFCQRKVFVMPRRVYAQRRRYITLPNDDLGMCSYCKCVKSLNRFFMKFPRFGWIVSICEDPTTHMIEAFCGHGSLQALERGYKRFSWVIAGTQAYYISNSLRASNRILVGVSWCFLVFLLHTPCTSLDMLASVRSIDRSIVRRPIHLNLPLHH